MPGAAPFTRGTHATVRGLGWHIHQRVVSAGPGAANKVILEELEGGASGVVSANRGARPDRHRNRGRDPIGRGAGRRLSRLRLRAACRRRCGSVEAARNLLGALELLKSKPGEPPRRLNVDPIGTLARFGAAGTPITQALATREAGARSARAAPRRRASGRRTVPHEAGGQRGAGARLPGRDAYRLPARLRGRRRRSERRVPRSPSRLSVDADLFLGAAKLRAARTIIARIADAAKRRPARCTSRRHVSAHDGQARSVDQHAAHDGCMRCRRVRRSRRRHRAALSRGRSARPIGSRGALRATPSSCCRRNRCSAASSIRSAAPGTSKSSRRTCEEGVGGCSRTSRPKGGIVAALSSGALADDIGRVAQARAKAIATGRLELTGVSVFPLLGDDGVKVAPYRSRRRIRGQARA